MKKEQSQERRAHTQHLFTRGLDVRRGEPITTGMNQIDRFRARYGAPDQHGYQTGSETNPRMA